MARKKVGRPRNSEIVIKTTTKKIYINNLLLAAVLLFVFYAALKYVEVATCATSDVAFKATLISAPIVLCVSLICSYFTCSSR